jgi:hypothetical protein
MTYLNTLVLTLLGFLPFPESVVYSDFTARGGETKVSVLTDETGVRLEGNLLGVLNRNGLRVGFVGIRTPIALDKSPNLFIMVEGIQKIKMRAVFSTLNRSVPNNDGELTYQTLLEPTNVSNLYKIDLNKLMPTVRGRNIGVTEAPIFRNGDVIDFALEIKLSEQLFNQDEGMDFNFKVFWK